eukprot:205252_1
MHRQLPASSIVLRCYRHIIRTKTLTFCRMFSNLRNKPDLKYSKKSEEIPQKNHLFSVNGGFNLRDDDSTKKFQSLKESFRYALSRNEASHAVSQVFDMINDDGFLDLIDVSRVPIASYQDCSLARNTIFGLQSNS